MAKKPEPSIRPNSEKMPVTDFNRIGEISKPLRPGSEPPNVQKLRRDVKRMQQSAYRGKDKQ